MENIMVVKNEDAGEEIKKGEGKKEKMGNGTG